VIIVLKSKILFDLTNFLVKYFYRSKLSKCSSCKIMHYCDSNCQKQDWKMHKIECEKFSKINFQLIYNDQIRLFIRVLIMIKNREADVQDSKGLKTFNTLMDRM
jgi:SET and MYND domain-containing protein